MSLNSQNKILKNNFYILIADKIDLSAITFLHHKYFKITEKFGISNDDIINNYNNYDAIIIRSKRVLNKDFFKKSNIPVIATCSKGLDHIDIESARKKNVKIIFSESGNSDSAAEHTIGLILEILKRISLSDKLVRDNKFEKRNFLRFQLKEKKIGIIGFGQVGSRVGKILKSFGTEVYVNDINREVKNKNQDFTFKSLNFILKNCDIVTVHIPLNKKNIKYLSKEKLDLLSKSAIFINTSRGGVADEYHLIKLLKSNRIYFAGLDVFENEPHINNEFFHLENTILTNHIAGKTPEAYRNILNEISLKVKNYFIENLILS